MIGTYGRQWTPPRASLAFDSRLIAADKLMSEGMVPQAIKLYRELNDSSYIAARRLKTIKRQYCRSSSSLPLFAQKCEIRLGFIDWYNEFDGGSNYILDLFLDAGITASACDPYESDILIAGCYGNQLLENQPLSEDKLVIFASGENLAPSYHVHDFSITTIPNSFLGKNVRLPQWYGELDFLDDVIYFASGPKPEIICGNRDLAISAIYNNSTPQREEAVAVLREVFGEANVHVFGNQRTGQINKMTVLSRSKINICFENSIGPGYVTEKLLHAKMMGCNALYWGDFSYQNDFSSVNTYNHYCTSSIQGMVLWCKDKLSHGDMPIGRWTNRCDPSIFSCRPSHKLLYKKVREWSSMIVNMRNGPL